MKKYIVLLVLTLATSLTAQDGMTLMFGSSFNRQNNYRMTFGLSDAHESPYMEIYVPNLSTSVIRDLDNKEKYFVSANSLIWPIAKIVNLAAPKRSPLNVPFMMALVLLQELPNAKLEPYLYKDNLRLRLGFNTDYYMFQSPSKVYSEFIFGFAYSNYNIKILCDCSSPLMKGYLKDKDKGFLNLSLSYTFDETPLTHSLIYLDKENQPDN
ncbi:MAG: hypothetical protein HF314_04100 [Ignavibacteria bacterium]|jgi:hypothetical protein|nr:hypothetical protein [Ignavibacteria bacterium]MCU7502232.1 hypothetical protein [Ignavibacteria bacterium]MCU7516724.1 hypothetical protein [Ignavibacteria bacterium]